jgi:hypothetical protein
MSTPFSVDKPDGHHKITALFHPRRDVWSDHFKLEEAQIVPLTPEGRVTVFVLKLNDPIRVRARQALIEGGRYPSSEE